MHTLSCPKCTGEMVRGFCVDHSQAVRMLPAWLEGIPKRSFFGFVKVTYKQIPIAVFRCSECGYLESYARPEFKLQFAKSPKQ